MTTQLRLVDPADAPRAPRRARPVRARSTRAPRWAGDWRLDARARHVGRRGVAAARDELARAAEPGLPRAS